MTRLEFEQHIRSEARSWVGVGFTHNGRTKSQGVDCLGLVLCFYKSVGLEPPMDGKTYQFDWAFHAAEHPYFIELMGLSIEVPRDRLKVGDTVYFQSSALTGAGVDVPTHSGLYLGSDEFIHSITGRGVSLSNLTTRIWRNSFVGARRPLALMTLLGETE